MSLRVINLPSKLNGMPIWAPNVAWDEVSQVGVVAGGIADIPLVDGAYEGFLAVDAANALWVISQESGTPGHWGVDMYGGESGAVVELWTDGEGVKHSETYHSEPPLGTEFSIDFPPEAFLNAPTPAGSGNNNRRTNVYPISGAIKANGLTATGDFEGEELAVQGVFNPEPGSVSLSGVMRNIMTLLATAAYVVIDLANRKLFGSDDDVIVDAVTGDADTKTYVFTPDADQEGRSLTWSGVDGSGFDSGATEALDALIAQTKPTYTVESLVAAIARSLPDGLKAGVAVDQDAKTVTVCIQTNVAKSIKGVAEAQSAPTNLVTVELEDAPVSSGNSDLPFEGGAV